jgi:hypothetical protein
MTPQILDLELLHHIPNGGARPKRTRYRLMRNGTFRTVRYCPEGQRLAKMGVKEGVPDLFWPVPRGEYGGLYIEMKTETGKATKAERWWIVRLAENGYFSVIAFGAEEAIRILTWYHNLGKPKEIAR